MRSNQREQTNGAGKNGLSESGRGDLNLRPWRLRRHALAGVLLVICEVTRHATRLNFFLSRHCLFPIVELFGVKTFPRDTMACRYILAGVMLTKSIPHVLR